MELDELGDPFADAEVTDDVVEVPAPEAKRHRAETPSSPRAEPPAAASAVPQVDYFWTDATFHYSGVLILPVTGYRVIR
jgi:hypothetical protein